MELRFTLDMPLDSHKRAKKSRCPTCNRMTFVRYINKVTFEYLPYEYGRCERINSCGHHLKPDLSVKGSTLSTVIQKPDDLNKVRYIHSDIFNKFKKSTLSSNLHIHLKKLFREDAAKLMDLYNVTSYRDGLCIFWQKDYWGNFRTGKIMMYAKDQFRRDKSNGYNFDFVHRAMIRNGHFTNYVDNPQCFFGEHLLRLRPNAPVAIVEGEKTALIMTMYEPDLIWISAGSLSIKYIWEDRRNIEKFKDRRVRVYPDTNGLTEWRQRTSILKHMGINVALYTDWFDDKDLGGGEDIADYYLETYETGIAIDDGAPLIWKNPLHVWE